MQQFTQICSARTYLLLNKQLVNMHRKKYWKIIKSFGNILNKTKPPACSKTLFWLKGDA